LAALAKGPIAFYLQPAVTNDGDVFVDPQAITNDELRQLIWLEKENARLQRLVAELLIKNEELRQMHLAYSTASDS
jgi:hypothetical protein